MPIAAVPAAFTSSIPAESAWALWLTSKPATTNVCFGDSDWKSVVFTTRTAAHLNCVKQFVLLLYIFQLCIYQ